MSKYKVKSQIKNYVCTRGFLDDAIHIVYQFTLGEGLFEGLFWTPAFARGSYDINLFCPSVWNVFFSGLAHFFFRIYCMMLGFNKQKSEEPLFF